MKKYALLLIVTTIIMLIIFGIDEYFYLKRSISSPKSIPNTQIHATQSSDKSSNLSVNIPILMYHSIDYGDNDLFVTPTTFESHMHYLLENDYNFINFEDLDKGNLPQKPIIITFDDGYDNIYTNVYPVLKENNIKVTAFIIVNNINKYGYLTKDEILSTNDLISYQSHTLSHPDLRGLSASVLDEELGLSKERLQTLVNNRVVCLSYPSGRYNTEVINTAKKYYSFAVTTQNGVFNLNNNRFTINRIRISKGNSAILLKDMLPQ